MRFLIRKILKEEFQNDEVMSSEKNICDIMTVNSWEEIQRLLDVMDYDDQFQEEIDKIKEKWGKEVSNQSNKLDSTNTHLRMVQNIVCR